MTRVGKKPGRSETENACRVIHKKMVVLDHSTNIHKLIVITKTPDMQKKKIAKKKVVKTKKEQYQDRVAKFLGDLSVVDTNLTRAAQAKFMSISLEDLNKEVGRLYSKRLPSAKFMKTFRETFRRILSQYDHKAPNTILASEETQEWEIIKSYVDPQFKRILDEIRGLKIQVFELAESRAMGKGKGQHG
jgi:hypothetical protein